MLLDSNHPQAESLPMIKLSPRITTLLAATTVAGISGATIAGAAGSGTTGSTGSTPAQRSADGTATQERGERGDGGHRRGGGRGMHADLAAVAKTLGVTEAKLKSAAESARPDKAAGKQDRGSERTTTIATSLGESKADVQAVLDSVRGDDDGDRGRGPGGHDDTALVAALVKKFSVSQAKAQTAVDAAKKAHDAEREANQTTRYAAIAKALGKDASAVQKAFEANEPVKPTP